MYWFCQVNGQFGKRRGSAAAADPLVLPRVPSCSGFQFRFLERTGNSGERITPDNLYTDCPDVKRVTGDAVWQTVLRNPASERESGVYFVGRAS